MHPAPMRAHPHPAHPVQYRQHRAPDPFRPGIQPDHIFAAQVQGEDHDCRVAGNHAHGLDQRGVIGEVATAVGFVVAGLLVHLQLRVAFDKGQGQEKEDRKRQQPEGHVHLDRRRSGQDSDCIEQGESQAVDEYDAFEAKGIERRQYDVAGQPLPQSPVHEEPQEKSQAKQDRGDQDALPHGEDAGGEGAVFFAGVAPVAFKIQQVVADVHRGGAEAECGKGKEQCRKQVWFVDPVGGQDGYEDKEVLEPLMWAQGLEPRTAAVVRAGERHFDFSRGSRLVAHVWRSIDDDRSPRHIPDVQVGRGVAGIIKTFFAETLDEHSSLDRSGKVCRAVTGEHFVEDAQMCSDISGEPDVRCRAQDKFSSLCVLVA